MERLSSDLIWEILMYLSSNDIFDLFNWNEVDEKFLLYYSKVYHLKHGCQIDINDGVLTDGRWFLGIKHGIHQVFLSQNGWKIYSDSYYVGGSLNGYKWTWYPNGNLKSEEFYVNSRLHGRRYDWSHDGFLTSCQNYYLGNQHGINHRYFDQGKLESTYSYNHGLLDGPSITYYFNGRMSLYREYDNNKLCQYQYEWWENGHIKSIQEYKHGVRHGIKITWYSTSISNEQSLRSVKYFVSGEKHGPSRKWYSNRRLKKISYYYHGLKCDSIIYPRYNRPSDNLSSGEIC